jgi:multimeric flavodoxin WrbA
MAEKHKSQKILGIVGSPRKGGNTDILVDEVLAGAKAAGAEIEKVNLAKLTIHPCQGCNACAKLGKCFQKDDMENLFEKMAVSSTWVLGTPVYWWGPTAQFKAYLDRWYGKESAFFSGKRIILAIPLGGSAIYARHTLGLLKDVVNYLGMRLHNTILAPGCGGRGEVSAQSEIVKQARQAGSSVIER